MDESIYNRIFYSVKLSYTYHRYKKIDKID